MKHGGILTYLVVLLGVILASFTLGFWYANNRAEGNGIIESVKTWKSRPRCPEGFICVAQPSPSPVIQ